MPMYEIHHAYPLNESQKDQLAEAITGIHTNLFTTPSNFVHVFFYDTSQTQAYMAGKKRKSNIIRANIRAGPSRTEEHYQSLCNSINQSWTKVVGDANSEETKIRAIFVLGTIISGWEGGFMIPQAGKDQEWLRENLPDMKRAAKTDHDMADMLSELQTRDEFRDVFTNGIQA